ncbi:podoplanin isoform X1 [Pelobates cultripes]|uniref:Podoplanin isoform X1 n=1 Tax=Pelobates cultripes TaxID=61616 RepID=A0AAD1T8K3_PELCU|nr:podoplanin isoform X1 [Pelobates cultripes]
MFHLQIFISLLISLVCSACAQEGTLLPDTADGTVDITEKTFTDPTEFQTQVFTTEYNVTEHNHLTEKSTVETEVQTTGSDNSTNFVVIEEPEEGLGLAALVGIVAGIIMLIGISAVIIILIVRKMGRYSP